MCLDPARERAWAAAHALCQAATKCARRKEELALGKGWTRNRQTTSQTEGRVSSWQGLDQEQTNYQPDGGKNGGKSSILARAGPGTDKLPARRREELALGKGWTRNRQTTSQTEGRVSSWQGLDQEQTNYQPDGGKSSILARAGPGTDKLPARRREELALGKGWTRNRQTTSQAEGRVRSWQGLDQEQTNYQPDGGKSSILARAGPGTDKLPARRREELALGKGWTRNRQTTSQAEGRVSSWQGLDQEQTNYQPDGGKSSILARAGPGTDKLPARRREELALGKGWTRNRQTTSQTEGRVSSWQGLDQEQTNYQPDGGKS
ncbi:hypothetical protein RRG08_052115 [Elysia crispata]|uniref:Uncharacterized protein n=1 Tax=Elysia crispata TaxID=231223 RepID=A0AAE1A469_9GAST|nr:hypothetical protein RRG08_052115 [Elysia crispata]